MADNINDIVAPSAYEDLDKLVEKLGSTKEALNDVAKTVITMQASIGNGFANIKQQAEAIDKFNASLEQMNTLEAENVEIVNKIKAAQQQQVTAITTTKSRADELKDTLVLLNDQYNKNQQAMKALDAPFSSNRAQLEKLREENASLAEQMKITRANISSMGETMNSQINIANKFEKIFVNMGVRLALNATIFAVANAAISKLTDAITKSYEEAQKYSKALEEIDRSAAASAAAETAKAKILFDNAANYNLAMDERLKSVSKLLELYPNFLNNESQEAFLTGKAADNMNKLTAAILSKARASANEKKIEEASKKGADQSQDEDEAQKRFDNARDRYKKLLGQAPDENNRSPVQQKEINDAKSVMDVMAFGLATTRNRVAETKKEIEGYIGEVAKFNEQAENTLNPKHAGKSIDDIREELKVTTQQLDHSIIGTKQYIDLLAKKKQLKDELRDAEGKPAKGGGKAPITTGIRADFSGDKELAEAKAKQSETDKKIILDTNKAIMEDTDRTLDERVAAQIKFQSAQLGIANDEASKVKQIESDKQKELSKLKNKTQNEDTSKFTKSQFDNQKLQIDAYDKQIEASKIRAATAEDSKQKAITDATNQGSKDRLSIYENELSKTLGILDNKTASKLAALEQKTQQKIEAILNDGTISGKKRTKAIDKVRRDATIEAGGIKEDNDKTQIGVISANADAGNIKQDDALPMITKKVNDITSIHAQGEEQITKNKKDEEDKRKEITKKAVDETTELIQGAVEATQTIRNNGFIAEQQQLELEMQQNQLKAQQEIQNVSATTGSNIEKAQTLSTINAQSQAQQNQIAAEQRKINHDAAVAQKQAAITSIEVNGAAAIIKIFAEADDYYLAAAEAIVMGGLIAEQLAAAQSAPIPAYKEGTDYHPGGPAIVGDGYTPELITPPSGRPFFSPDKPTAMWLNKGTIVTPIESLVSYYSAVSVPQNAHINNEMSIAGIDKYTMKVNDGLQEVRNAIIRYRGCANWLRRKDYGTYQGLQLYSVQPHIIRYIHTAGNSWL